MNKKAVIFIMTLIFVMSMGSMVFATGEASTKEMPSLFTTTDQTNVTTVDSGLPDVTIDDATDWADRKGAQVITMLQKFAQPFTIIIFIFCAILALIGAFGDSRMITKGIQGMAISLMVYAAIIYAPKIMDVFLSFIGN